MIGAKSNRETILTFLRTGPKTINRSPTIWASTAAPPEVNSASFEIAAPRR